MDTTKLNWRKSTRSHYENCVEVAAVDDDVAVRHSKDPSGPMLRFSRPAWDALIRGVKAGQFG